MGERWREGKGTGADRRTVSKYPGGGSRRKGKVGGRDPDREDGGRMTGGRRGDKYREGDKSRRRRNRIRKGGKGGKS